MMETMIRVPLTHGLPWQISGWTEIRSLQALATSSFRLLAITVSLFLFARYRERPASSGMAIVCRWGITTAHARATGILLAQFGMSDRQLRVIVSDFRLHVPDSAHPDSREHSVGDARVEHVSSTRSTQGFRSWCLVVLAVDHRRTRRWPRRREARVAQPGFPAFSRADHRRVVEQPVFPPARSAGRTWRGAGDRSSRTFPCGGGSAGWRWRRIPGSRSRGYAARA